MKGWKKGSVPLFSLFFVQCDLILQTLQIVGSFNLDCRGWHQLMGLRGKAALSIAQPYRLW